MNDGFISFDRVKQLYPNEWVLLGNPDMNNTTVVGGTVLYHSKDKKEVCYIGKDKTEGYSKVTIAFAGDIANSRKIGILKQI
jgi:hypothetical protein